MAKIHKLSPALADMIAAGEVVERPSSVIKELVENSIDAGATKITVEIKNGGITFMRVTDDGCGIAPEDAPTAFLRHATSKISCAEDLNAISTMGFRGEALAAISAVSKMDLMTKTADAELGVSLRIEAGDVLDVQPAGCPKGTTMIVRELFYNTPARMKFLKRDSVEGGYISGAVQRQALGHPEIAFRFIRDGKLELSTPGDGKLISTIYAAMGRECAREMELIHASTAGVGVDGYVGRPVASRGSRSYQHFFVNGRYVKSRLMSAAFEEAYRNQLMVGRFPICVLHITLPPEAVDVNVHPAKTEVKFLRESDLYDAIHYSVLSVLNQADARPELVLKQAKPPAAAGNAVPQPTAQTQKLQQTQPVSQTKPQSGAAHTAQPAGKQNFYQHMTAEQYRAVSGFAEKSREISPTQAAIEQLSKNAERREPAAAVHDSAKSRPAVQSASAPSEKQTAPAKTAETPYGNVKIHTISPVEPEKKAPAPEIVPEAVPQNTQEEQEALEMPALQEMAKMPEPPKTETPKKAELLPYKIIGQAFDTYIIVEQGNELLMFDKHAAHERILFEKFKAQEHEIMSQLLLEPLYPALSREETVTLLSNIETLDGLGFTIEDFGNDRLVVRAIPADIAVKDAAACLSELAEKLMNGQKLDKNTVYDELLHTMACKAAIKGGWKTDPKELAALIAELMSRDDIKYCPHGRPVCISLTKSSLERQFKRT